MLTSLLLLAWVSLSQQDGIKRIQRCGTRCTKGLQCRAKPHLIFGGCRSRPEALSAGALSRLGLAAVMQCEGRQRCALHLSISAEVQTSKHIHGVSLCMVTMGMMEHCRTVNLPRTANSGLVEIQDDCLKLAPGLEVNVTLTTVPKYCGLALSRAYRVPDCRNEDLRHNVPECITGRIGYKVDSARKELSVTVSDMLEERDYHLRLCYKGYICRGTGAHALLKKESPFKNVTFPYSRPLPCLCIEGWSSVTDAPRVQVCPFKNRTEELWSGMTFDPVEETLAWEPACQVEASVTLCQMLERGVCQDLVNSTQTSTKGKVTFSKVDPHPRLCMKFATEAGVWVKCPFAQESFSAWHLEMADHIGHHKQQRQQVVVTSRVRASFSLSVCSRNGPFECVEDKDSTAVHLERFQSVTLNLTTDSCNDNTCIKAKRTDVNYAVSLLTCHFQCNALPLSVHAGSHRGPSWAAVLVLAIVTAVLTTVVMTGFAVMVYQMWLRRRPLYKVSPFNYSTDPYCDDERLPAHQSTQRGPAPEYEETHTVDDTHSKHCETANLLTRTTEDVEV